ncbi:putative HECT domain, ubiquitin [Medicago truncatula]|uniref:HECT-type E3 ubiquitin transferase n=1 Tax=Medicago truncatula TaxID=3880 RepID=A0A396JBV1_MEDTR|nr:putative HECT domain, ubiquitin [Medicago truncatula]
MKKITKTKSSKLQFFVRMMWNCNTLVIRASREKTVESLLEQISSKTRIPIQHQRLIYEGKQLTLEQSLCECGIENDANLQLVGRLRSIACPKVWKATQYIVSLILRLCRGELVIGASRIIDDHLTYYINDSEYFSVFMFMEIPSLLVALYMSRYANACVADSVIKDFVRICLDLKDKKLQGVYLEVSLEFCELLRRARCKYDDPLYVFCRDSFSSLLTLVGRVNFQNPKGEVMLRGVFDCVHEIADELLRFLDLSMNCPTGEGFSFNFVLDFVKFSGHLRMGLAEQQATSDEFLNCTIGYEEEPLIAGVVDQLHIVFIKLLSKMDECLQVMEDCLVNKKHGKGDGAVINNGWSHYIIILKVLYHISKLYSGAKEMFWEVLLRQKSMLSHMIVRYSKNTDDHRWVLENRSVTDFECRRHLAMMMFPDLNDESLGYEMLIDRSQLLAESFEYISQANSTSLEGGLFMEFRNEEGTGPGVVREWLVLVCQEIFNPEHALFVACPNDRRRFFPNAGEFRLEFKMHNFTLLHAIQLEYFQCQ